MFNSFRDFRDIMLFKLDISLKEIFKADMDFKLREGNILILLLEMSSYLIFYSFDPLKNFISLSEFSFKIILFTCSIPLNSTSDIFKLHKWISFNSLLTIFKEEIFKFSICT